MKKQSIQRMSLLIEYQAIVKHFEVLLRHHMLPYTCRVELSSE